jgi:hypothetical protein
MSCDGLNALNPLCQAGAALAGQAAGVVDSAFTQIAGSFGVAALSATEWLWQQIDTATAIDLSSPELRAEMTLVGSIAAVLCVGLFLVQIITAILRREPGGLRRAAVGLVTSFLGSALALAATRALIGVVDALSAGVVQHTMGTNVSGLGSKLTFAGLAAQPNPAVTLLFALLILAAAVIVWAAMMIRKISLLIAAVLAPLAFAGATADVTRGWVRKWIEFVCAMIASKLLLVIILSIGISILEGAGQASGGVAHTGTQLAAGTLVLLLGGLSPWIALRAFHFAGDSLAAAHASSGVVTAGAQKAIAAPQKVMATGFQAAALTSSGGAAAGLSAGRSGPATAAMFKMQGPPANGAPGLAAETAHAPSGQQSGLAATGEQPGADGLPTPPRPGIRAPASPSPLEGPRTSTEPRGDMPAAATSTTEPAPSVHPPVRPALTVPAPSKPGDSSGIRTPPQGD